MQTVKLPGKTDLPLRVSAIVMLVPFVGMLNTKIWPSCVPGKKMMEI